MIPTDIWFPVVTLLVGTGLGGVLEALRDRRALRREAIARGHAQEEADRTRRREFQRATIIALQDECANLTRRIGQMHHHDAVSSADDGSKWATTPMPVELSQGALATAQQVGKLRVRVADGELRELVARLTTIYGNTGAARSEQAAQAAIAPLSHCIETINERIGVLLREC